MILNLVPVLFHLLFYQYLIFQLLVLIRRSLLQEAHSADTADVHDCCGRCIYPESTFCACLGSEGHSPLFLMKTLQSCKHQCTQSPLQSRVLGQEGWFTASEKLEESEF